MSILNLKVGTKLVKISIIIVFDINRIVRLKILLENNRKDNSIVRVVKLIALNYYNCNRERVLQ